MFVVLIGWALFAIEDMGRLGVYLKACFGGADFIRIGDLYHLRSYAMLLVILCVAATPVGKKAWQKLGEKTQAVLAPILVMASLILCTASLVDASYNPFLYFRF